jgi:hypothetical protein
MPYTDDHGTSTTPDELRARIPGWGADLDPADRPSVPKERRDLITGAHWSIPESQPELVPRERSIEHGMLPPVFGTVAPLHGLSGIVRRVAYARYSEGRAAHWFLLVLGDRIDAWESHLRSLWEGHPDNPIAESGILGEPKMRPIASRIGRGRADGKHAWLDPLVFAGPVVLALSVVIVLKMRRGTH